MAEPVRIVLTASFGEAGQLSPLTLAFVSLSDASERLHKPNLLGSYRCPSRQRGTLMFVDLTYGEKSH